MKDSIDAAYDFIGGDETLGEWAKDNLTIFLTQIWVKTLPKELKAQIETHLSMKRKEIVIVHHKPSPEIPESADRSGGDAVLDRSEASLPSRTEPSVGQPS